IQAGADAGYPRTDDLNGYQQEGFGPMDRFVTPNGRRASAARGYLDMARHRERLTILTGALTDVVLFDGKRARGVRFQHQGRLKTVEAQREVMVCTGAIASPQILQRSGIGPGSWLKEAGVAEILDLPGVGSNLQDHLELYI
ncbi:choline dehydrogenase, partial [Bacillus stratosphericus]